MPESKDPSEKSTWQTIKHPCKRRYTLVGISEDPKARSCSPRFMVAEEPNTCQYTATWVDELPCTVAAKHESTCVWGHNLPGKKGSMKSFGGTVRVQLTVPFEANDKVTSVRIDSEDEAKMRSGIHNWFSTGGFTATSNSNIMGKDDMCDINIEKGKFKEPVKISLWNGMEKVKDFTSTECEIEGTATLKNAANLEGDETENDTKNSAHSSHPDLSRLCP